MSDSTVASENSHPAYASFIARFRALAIDAVVLTLCFLALFVLTIVASSIPGTGVILVVSLVAIVLLYEPILVSRFGGTIGHRRNNLRVVTDSTGQNPGFLRALARYLVKTVLGLLSFVTMALTARHQAVHDRLTGTTVQIRDLSVANPLDIRWEREESPLIGLPSRLRRVLVIVSYQLLLVVGLALVQGVLISDACTFQRVCSTSDSAFDLILSLAYIAAAAAVIILGWKGRLWGARRRDVAESSTDLSNTR